MIRSLLLGIGLLCFGVVPATAQEAGQQTPLTLKVADLSKDRALDATLGLAQPGIGGLMAAVEKATQRSFIVLGPISMQPNELARLQGAQARVAVQALADSIKSEWRQYAEFYLLFPHDMLRHHAGPNSDADHSPELKRKVDQDVSGRNLTTALQRIGRNTRVFLRLGGFRVPPPVTVRATWPCIIEAQGKTVAEVMDALTAMLGDPWDREATTHILCCTGDKLTAEDRRDLDHVLALDHFQQSLTRQQSQLLTADQGLGWDQLTPYQQRDLARAVAPMAARKGITTGTIMLRRSASGSGGFEADVHVYAVGPSGAVSLGYISWPE